MKTLKNRDERIIVILKQMGGLINFDIYDAFADYIEGHDDDEAGAGAAVMGAQLNHLEGLIKLLKAELFAIEG